MDAKERAEKIINHIEDYIAHDALDTAKWVAAQIEEAEEEAYRKGYKSALEDSDGR